MLRAYILPDCDAPRKPKLYSSSTVASCEVCHWAQSRVKLAPIRKEEQVGELFTLLHGQMHRVEEEDSDG